jgi:argininosuccinate lyase
VCVAQGCDLADLSLDALRHATSLGGQAELIGADVQAVLTLEGSIAARNHIGGTAPEQVRQAIAVARQTWLRLFCEK